MSLQEKWKLIMFFFGFAFTEYVLSEILMHFCFETIVFKVVLG